MEKDRLEVLIEEVLDRVQFVAEGHDLLSRKTDRIAAELVETRRDLNEKIMLVADNLTETKRELNQRLDETNQKIDETSRTLNQRIDETNQKLDNLSADLAAHRADTESHRGYQIAER
jgi:hypothetical protein